MLVFAMIVLYHDFVTRIESISCFKHCCLASHHQKNSTASLIIIERPYSSTFHWTVNRHTYDYVLASSSCFHVVCDSIVEIFMKIWFTKKHSESKKKHAIAYLEKREASNQAWTSPTKAAKMKKKSWINILIWNITRIQLIVPYVVSFFPDCYIAGKIDYIYIFY